MNEHKIVNGEVVYLTADEIAEIKLARAAYVPVTASPAATKEQLLVELAALATKIEALA